MDRSGIFFRVTPRARSASTRGSRSPPIRASSLSRADFVVRLDATGSVLMPASSHTLPSRCSSLVRDWMSFLRYRVVSRSAAMSAGGM